MIKTSRAKRIALIAMLGGAVLTACATGTSAEDNEDVPQQVLDAAPMTATNGGLKLHDLGLLHVHEHGIDRKCEMLSFQHYYRYFVMVCDSGNGDVKSVTGSSHSHHDASVIQGK